MENHWDTLAVSEDEDPMKFIEESKSYHDWTVVVNDPHSHSEKEFSVVALNLAAHSSVFRKMMTDPKWVKEKRLVIPNMSPQTFDLIYRYVNAGELGLQKLSREDVADLALAADQYMIPRLVQMTFAYLKPSNVDEMIPALTVVSFIPNTDLEPIVAKFVELNTQYIMMSAKFLVLDGRCIEFIAKQEFLSVPELELWKNLVKWAQHQVADDESKTLRSVLEGALKYVRFRTLTQVEIVKEVVPTSILSGEELATLFCAVIGKQPWNQAGLCGSEAMRQQNTLQPSVKKVEPLKTDGKVHVFNPIGLGHKDERVCYSSQAKQSTFTIETKKNIQLELFYFRPKPVSQLGAHFYTMECTINVKQRVDDVYSFLCNIKCSKQLFGGDKKFTVPAMTTDNHPVFLEANRKYYFTVDLSPQHSAYATCLFANPTTSTTHAERTVKDVMSVQYHSGAHIIGFLYKI